MVTLHSILTVLVFICFMGIVWWAYSARQKKGFDEAANLPFADAEDQGDSPNSDLGSTLEKKPHD